MARKRRSFGSGFKAKVAVEAVRGLKTLSELAQDHKIHPNQVMQWKRQLLEGAEGIFEGGPGKGVKSDEPDAAELYEQIGRLKVELEWLKKKTQEQ
jgi:putative transposase